MTINWGSQTPIPPSQVIAQLPVIQQPTAGGALSQAVSGFADQYNKQQQLGMEQQNIDINKQQLIEQQKNGVLARQSTQLDINKKEAEAKTAAQMQQAYAVSKDNGDKWFAQNDPVGFADYQVKTSTYDTNKAAAAKAMAETVPLQIQAAEAMDIKGAHMAQDAAAGRNPQEQQQIWKIQRDHLIAVSPQYKDVYPETFDAGTYKTLTEAGINTSIRQKQEEEDKNATPEMKNAKKIADLQDKVNNKTASTSDLSQLKSLQDDQASKTKDNKPAIQQTVEYITGLTDAVNQAPEGSPERQKAQDKLDYAITQAKQDTTLWSQIKTQVAKAVGSGVGAVVNSVNKSPAGTAAKAVGSITKVWTYNPKTGKLE